MIRHLNKETKTTKSMGKLKLIYFEIYNTRSDAMQREKFFKSYKGYRIRHELIKKFSHYLVDDFDNISQLVESL